IHRRLVRAMGGYTDDDLVPLHEAALQGRAAYAEAFLTFLGERPDLARVVPLVLAETLGPTLVDEYGPGAETVAAVWGLCQTAFLSYPSSVQRAGFADGEALFQAVAGTPSGVVFTVDPYEETIARMETPDKKVNLVVDELVDELRALAHEAPPTAAAGDDF